MTEFQTIFQTPTALVRWSQAGADVGFEESLDIARGWGCAEFFLHQNDSFLLTQETFSYAI